MEATFRKGTDNVTGATVYLDPASGTAVPLRSAINPAGQRIYVGTNPAGEQVNLTDAQGGLTPYATGQPALAAPQRQSRVAVPPALDGTEAPAPAPAPTDSRSVRSTLSAQMGSGAEEGLAAYAGAPSDILEMGANAALNAVDPFKLRTRIGLPERVDVPGGADDFRAMREASGHIVPRDPALGTMRDATNIAVSMGLPMPVKGLNGGAGQRFVDATGPVSTATRALKEALGIGTAATGAALGDDAGAAIGSAAGGVIGQQEAGENTGRAIGGLVGAMVPAGVRQMADAGVKASLGTKDSPGKIAALREHGVDPSFGLVGNSGARRIENVVGTVPVVGGGVPKRQDRQTVGVEAALDRTLGAMRSEGTPVPRAGDTGAIGQETRRMGAVGLEGVEGKLNDLTNKRMDMLGGANQAVDVSESLRSGRNSRPKLTPQGQSALDPRMSDLKKMKTDPIDAGLHRTLTRRQATQEKDLATATAANDAPAVRKAQQELRVTAAKIEANLGVKAGRLDQWRSENAQRSATGQRLDRGTMKTLNKASQKDEGRAVAAHHGKASTKVGEYMIKRNIRAVRTLVDKAMDKAKGGDKPALQAIANAKDENTAYNLIFKRGAGNLLVLRRNSSKKDWDNLAANFIKSLGAPKSQHAKTADVNTETFSPARFVTEWGKIPDEARRALIRNPAVRKQMDEVAEMAEMLGQRSKAHGGSTGGNLLVAGTLLGGATLSTGNIAPVAASAAITAGLGSKPFNDYVVKTLSKEYPDLGKQVLTRGAQGAKGITLSSEKE